MSDHKLTPAGKQVERALEQGYDVAAHNLYFANLREDVPMVEGDSTETKVSVWPEWHQMIQTRIGESKVFGQDVAEQEAAEQGLTAEQREDYIGHRIDELNEAFEPTIVTRQLRNERGEVVGDELASNPHLSGEDNA